MTPNKLQSVVERRPDLRKMKGCHYDLRIVLAWNTLMQFRLPINMVDTDKGKGKVTERNQGRDPNGASGVGKSRHLNDRRAIVHDSIDAA
jgi:hypothetical protein